MTGGPNIERMTVTVSCKAARREVFDGRQGPQGRLARRHRRHGLNEAVRNGKWDTTILPGRTGRDIS